MQDKKESELQLKKVSLPFTQPEVFTIRGNLTLQGFLLSQRCNTPFGNNQKWQIHNLSMLMDLF